MDGAFHLFHSAQACVSERWKGVWLGDAGECRQGDGGLGSGGKVVVVSDGGGGEGVGPPRFLFCDARGGAQIDEGRDEIY